VSQKSGLAEAIRYAPSHWEGLTRFLSDGRIETDSNTVERTMRPIALGRRNYLFAGSGEGGQTWSILASLINSALCRARHSADYAERRTMPNARVFPRIQCDRRVIDSHSLPRPVAAGQARTVTSDTPVKETNSTPNVHFAPKQQACQSASIWAATRDPASGQKVF
jgi:Transposase IS66 family